MKKTVPHFDKSLENNKFKENITFNKNYIQICVKQKP